jgi:hypothetical protein
VSQNVGGASLPIFQWGDCTQMWSRDALADHMTSAWLAKLFTDIKQYRKVHSSFAQTVGKITVCITEQKIIKK